VGFVCTCGFCLHLWVLFALVGFVCANALIQKGTCQAGTEACAMVSVCLQATAAGLKMLAQELTSGGGAAAAQLRVAEQYVEVSWAP
jgi:surface polysaccharide O-acyltransferase-like enzyme